MEAEQKALRTTCRYFEDVVTPGVLSSLAIDLPRKAAPTLELLEALSTNSPRTQRWSNCVRNLTVMAFYPTRTRPWKENQLLELGERYYLPCVFFNPAKSFHKRLLLVDSEIKTRAGCPLPDATSACRVGLSISGVSKRVVLIKYLSQLEPWDPCRTGLDPQCLRCRPSDVATPRIPRIEYLIRKALMGHEA